MKPRLNFLPEKVQIKLTTHSMSRSIIPSSIMIFLQRKDMTA